MYATLFCYLIGIWNVCLIVKPKTIHFPNLRINGCYLKAQFMQTVHEKNGSTCECEPVI